MIDNSSNTKTANGYNTIPHHEFNDHNSGDFMTGIKLKMDNVKDKMSTILQELDKLLVIMYP